MIFKQTDHITIITLSILALSGCASRNAYVNKDYKLEISKGEAAPVSEVYVKVTPVLFRSDGKPNLYIVGNDSVALVKKHIPSMLEKALEEKEISILKGDYSKVPAHTTLNIQPKNVEQKCATRNG